jgi:hypothetical protein
MTAIEIVEEYAKEGAVICLPDATGIIAAVGMLVIPKEGYVHWAEPFYFEQQHIHTFAYDSMTVRTENLDDSSDIIFTRNGRTIAVLTLVYSDHVPYDRYKQLWPLLHNWHSELEHPGKLAEVQADFNETIPTTEQLETL